MLGYQICIILKHSDKFYLIWLVFFLFAIAYLASNLLVGESMEKGHGIEVLYAIKFP